MSKLCEETSATVDKLRSERDIAASRHHGLLAFIRRIVKTREDRKDVAPGALVKLRKVYDDERKVTVEPHVAECSDLHDRITSSTNDS